MGIQPFEAGVEILTASDAHMPGDVGVYVQEMSDIIK